VGNDSNGFDSEPLNRDDGHLGFDFPVGGGNPFDPRQPWPGRLYWARNTLSRLFSAETTPPSEDLYRAIPPGYTTLTLLERISIIVPEKEPQAPNREAGHRFAGPLQPYQVILRSRARGDGTAFSAIMLGVSWPIRWAVGDAWSISARSGEPVLLCSVISHRNWH
jgi:hypothetical protein